MQSKGFIKLIAVLLALACVYQLSFTFKTRSVEKKAAEYAAQFPIDEQSAAEQHYLDSIQNLSVYNLGIRKFTYKECKEKELNLGLDLKGGMNVMLEVQVEDVVKALAGDSQNDPAFVEAIAEANEALKQGTSSDYIGDFVKAYSRLSNGRPIAEIFVSPDRQDITLESSDADVEKVLKQETEAAIGASFNVLRSRIDHFGVTQPNIMRLPNSHRILVELPGVKEPQRVRDLLQGTASLEFWLTYDANEVIPALVSADKLLKDELSQAAAQTEPVAEETPAAEAAATEDEGLIGEIGADSTASAEAVQTGHFDREQNPLFAVLDPNYAGGAAIGAAYKADMAAVNEYLSRPEVLELFPADILFKWGVKGDDHIDGRYYLYAIKVTTPDGKAPLDGSVVTDAREQYAQRGATAEVSMTMNAEGTQEWARLTGENIGKCIAIVLDGYVYSAPRVNTKIDKGQSQITGDFTIQEAQDLANVLNSGKVPAPAKIIQDTVVGPSLGQESINAGMLSFVIAFILVLLYMSLFYKTAGWMADIALLMNVFLLMGVLASFGAVLTLPGIAGIVLTMGMAVDANVIIYERIKEELREGKGISLAIKDGFSRAYSAIIDGQLTTIITGIVLFVFGTGPVQGFATTLIIGIITSIFCSIFITRLLIEWIVAKWGSISFSHKWSENFLSNTHVDFLSKRKVAYVISVVAIVLSIASFFVRGLNLGAEFTGGRAYVVRFDKPVSAEAVRASMEETFSQISTADASSISFEVKQYGNENQMRIVTQYRYDDMSDEATAEVEQVIYDALKSLYSYPITFDQFRSTQTDVNGILTADKIGPSIANDMTWNAIYSVLFSLIAIGLYITFRFKRWQWATGATLALAINALLIIGIFSMFYGILPFNLEVNQAFIAAILTIIGYAINDTVVVFDRIREYLGLYPKRKLKENVNNAINSTLSRTINTSGTTLVTLLAIFFFGGETIRGFIFALIIGVVVGTIATIFIATPIAYDLMAKRAKIDEE
ncbi:protein translocase subunit SecDF [uncultured Alistipes sp.]|uniref:protein translocase subunit SecDF n=1 Tax=uncultured Alistipes sp. TaxID=538949 RepID=UPI00320B5606